MAKEAKATYDAVIAAAEAIEKSGQTPSVRNVTAHIGGGSPNTINEHLRKWRAERPRIEARKTIVIDQRINDLIAEAVQNAADAAGATASAERDAALDEKDLIAQRGTELESEVEQLTQQIADLIQKGQHDAGVIEALKAEIEKAHADAADEVARIRAEAAAAIGEARAEATKERVRADQLVGELATANVRLEALRGVEDRLERVTAELRAEHDQRLEAQAKADTIPDLKDDIAQLRSSLAAVGEKLDAEREKLEQARSESAAAIEKARVGAAGELKALRETLEQRIEAERNRAADAEKVTVTASNIAAAEKARADALAAQVAQLTAQFEKSKPVGEAKK